MAEHRDYNDNSELTDDALVDREEADRREYRRLEEREPELRDTTYQKLDASPGLIKAWDRWWSTKVERRLRGLLSLVSRRRSEN
jgi:hypothetical protein